MIDLKGTISVAEAARRLDKSIEQVRRDLRAGRLRGQRVGNQWFVDEGSLVDKRKAAEPLIPPGTLARIDQLRREINERNRRSGRPPFDVVEMLRQHRDED